MSADNYYLVRRHPDGGFVALMGFASDDEEPTVEPGRNYLVYGTADEALCSVLDEYAEYGHSIHSECNLPLRTLTAMAPDNRHGMTAEQILGMYKMAVREYPEDDFSYEDIALLLALFEEQKQAFEEARHLLVAKLRSIPVPDDGDDSLISRDEVLRVAKENLA